ncbi:uncharacterized protein F5147DRAFT_622204 [Suillus discolor]|uniref:DUF6570 domain-containing protein n=1 Tax=Suillus discolor TaxID=1912936 RepID=A0A9P7ES08_9AGAM|nr:uncharacterized protein F5147DRAFT_622204 [Suillus discolor]KAG2083698.1 hypothetical protein F5147DRAFT_622204 [Suillus discolor]
MSDPYVIQKCVVQSISTCFSYGNEVIDGLTIDKYGLVFQGSEAVSMFVCPSCRTSLAQRKLPAFALANRLYRGVLSEIFQDLTWLEEKSSDPSQPKVFHGNTCAHDMNVMSTASVLPRTPADINGFLSVVFIGPDAFDPNRMGQHGRATTNHDDLACERLSGRVRDWRLAAATIV